MVTPGGGGKSLGNLVLHLKANAKGLQQGLQKAEKAATTRLGRMRDAYQGFANKVPVVGGALAGLATPAGAATAAIGLATAAVTKMVTKTLDLGRNLGEARERLKVSAEGIQIWRRAIEETNGNAAAFDASILRLTRSIGDANRGNKAAQDAFDALGLSWVDLAKKSPEEALKAVLGAANDTLDPTDKASVLALTLGRSYQNMGGLAHLSSDELDGLLNKVSETAVVMGGDAVTSVDDFDASWRDLRDMLGRVFTQVGTAIIPVLTDLIKSVIDVGTALAPVITAIGTHLKGALDIIFGALQIVAGLLTGDFSAAWDGMKKVAIGAMSQLVNIYNNTIARLPGVAKIDMAKIETAIMGVKEEVEATEKPIKTMEEAMTDAGIEAKDAAPKMDDLTTSTVQLTEKAETAADRIAKTKQAIEDWRLAAEQMPIAIDTAIGGGGGMGLNDLIEKLEEEERATLAAKKAMEEAKGPTEALANSFNILATEAGNAVKEQEDFERSLLGGRTARSGGGGGGGGGGVKPAIEETTEAIEDQTAALETQIKITGGQTQAYNTLAAAARDAAAAQRESAAAGGGGGGGAPAPRGGSSRTPEEIAASRAQGAAEVRAAVESLETEIATGGFEGIGLGSARGRLQRELERLEDRLADADSPAEKADAYSSAQSNIGGIRSRLAAFRSNPSLASLQRLLHFTEGVSGVFAGTRWDDTAAQIDILRGMYPNLPEMRRGGIAMPRLGGTIARLAEAGVAEAIIPLNRLPDMVARMQGMNGMNGGQHLTGDVTLKVDGFTEAVGKANLRIEERGG